AARSEGEAAARDRGGVHRPREGRRRGDAGRDGGGAGGGGRRGGGGGGIHGREAPGDRDRERDPVRRLHGRVQLGGVDGVARQGRARGQRRRVPAEGNGGRDRAPAGGGEGEAAARDRGGVHRPREGRGRGDAGRDGGGAVG